MFTKNECGSFKYWFAHWCAYQMTALNLRAWRFKYLFHDIEKPWLSLFMSNGKVQYIHRRNNRHHFEYKGGVKKIDYEAMIIDWECARFTKKHSQLSAVEFSSKAKNYFDKHNSTDDTILFSQLVDLAIKFLISKSH